MFCLQEKYRTQKYSNVLYTCITLISPQNIAILRKIKASVTTVIAFWSSLLNSLISRILFLKGSSKLYGRFVYRCWLLGPIVPYGTFGKSYTTWLLSLPITCLAMWPFLPSLIAPSAFKVCSPSTHSVLRQP